MKNIYTFNVLGVCVHVHHPFACYITHGKYCVEETHNPVCCIHTSVIEYIQISLHNLQQNILPLQQLSTVAQKLLKISHQSFLFFIIIYFVKKDMKVSIQLFLSSHDWRERGRKIGRKDEQRRQGESKSWSDVGHGGRCTLCRCVSVVGGEGIGMREWDSMLVTSVVHRAHLARSSRYLSTHPSVLA